MINSDDVTILVDYREGRSPYPIDWPSGFIVTSGALETGDFVAGNIVVERKSSVEDLYGTLFTAKRRAAFELEGARIQSFTHRYLALYFTKKDLLKGTRYSKVPGSVALRKVNEWADKHGVVILWNCDNDDIIRALKSPSCF